MMEEDIKNHDTIGLENIYFPVLYNNGQGLKDSFLIFDIKKNQSVGQILLNTSFEPTAAPKAPEATPKAPEVTPKAPANVPKAQEPVQPPAAKKEEAKTVPPPAAPKKEEVK